MRFPRSRRGAGAPPNMEAGRLAFLRAAVKKALTDPALVEESRKSGFLVTYGDAVETQ